MVFSVGPCRILPYSQISCIVSSTPATQPCWDLTSLTGLTGELCFRCHCSWAVYLSPSSCLACQPCPGSRTQEFRLPLSEGWASPWLAVLLCSCGQDVSTREGSTAVWDEGVWHRVHVGYCRDSASQTVFSHMWSSACLLAHTLLWFLISELHYVLFFAHCNLSLPNCEAWEGSTLNCAQREKGAGNRGKSQSQRQESTLMSVEWSWSLAFACDSRGLPCCPSGKGTGAVSPVFTPACSRWAVLQ